MNGFKKYKRFQKGIFFLKSDTLPQTSINIPTKIQINKIFQKFLGKKPVLIEKLNRSTLHNVFMVKADKKDYLLKANLLNNIYKELNFLNVELMPSPKTYLTDVSRKVVPFDYQISEYIKGESLYDLSHQNSITEHIKSLGSTLAYVHKIKTKGFGPFDVETAISKNELAGIHPKWSDYFFINLKKHLDFLKRGKAISPKDYQTISEIFKIYRRKIVCSSPRLLHGDVANHNAILSSGKIQLVDWEDAISGDPLYDIAFYATGVWEKKDWLKTFLSGYNKVRKISIDNTLFWLYFLRISLAKTIIRSRSGPSKEAFPDYNDRITYALEKIKLHD